MIPSESNILPTLVDELQEPVIRVLAYYDMFDHPLTAEEVYTFLPTHEPGHTRIFDALWAMANAGMIGHSRGYYYLPHRDERIVDRRIEMQRRGDTMWRIGRMMAWGLSHVPFVRGIFVSGQLCRYIADEKSDIDYFVVTEPGRLWIVRTIFMLIRVVLLLNNRKYLCANYFVTTDNLRIREHNLYTACEIASVKPVMGAAVHNRFLESNPWIAHYYPNYSSQQLELRNRPFEVGRLQRMLERLIPRRLAERLDGWLMDRSIALWNRKFGARAEQIRRHSYCMRRDEARAHPDDPSPTVLEGYQELLNRYAIPYD